MRAARALAILLVTASAAAAGEVPGATLVLEVFPEPTPGVLPEAAPPRFVLLEKGQFFVGGTSALAAGRLESRELKTLEGRIARVRKLPGLGSHVAFGAGSTRYRLSLPGKRPLEILATGDPSRAPAAVQPLASLVADLANFEHASLRLHRPDSYALLAREGALIGGCRPWTFPFSVADVLQAARVVSANLAASWPTGATAASACVGDKRYIVTLRPLLPGERP